MGTGLQIYGEPRNTSSAGGRYSEDLSLRLPRAGSASEDLIINGGVVAFGPGQFGDLATTNNVSNSNSGLSNGIAPTSPPAHVRHRTRTVAVRRRRYKVATRFHDPRQALHVSSRRPHP